MCMCVIIELVTEVAVSPPLTCSTNCRVLRHVIRKVFPKILLAESIVLCACNLLQMASLRFRLTASRSGGAID